MEPKEQESRPILFMEVDGVLYPTAMSAEEYNMFKMTVALLSPITIVKDKPQGKTVNLMDEKGKS